MSEQDRTLNAGEKIKIAFHDVYGHLETLAEARAKMAACPHARVESGPVPVPDNPYTEHLCLDCGCYWVTDPRDDDALDRLKRAAGDRQLPGFETPPAPARGSGAEGSE